MPDFYNGYELLNKLDLNGQKPEIYICASNRSAGKTTFFSNYLLKRFIKNKELFILLYRYKYELTDIAEKFFRDIHALYYPNDTFSNKSSKELPFSTLYFNDDICGYGIAINSAEQIKKYSHFFNTCSTIFFDEFQSESEKYVNNEIEKLLSIHLSVARGNGKQSRYVPTILCGNNISLLNPYYTSLGISQRLQSNTHFLRGDGYVLEINFNESAFNAQKSSAFNRAFQNERYIKTSIDKELVYLNDNVALIDNATGKNRYIASLIDGDNLYSLREYDNFLYIGRKVDSTFPRKIHISSFIDKNTIVVKDYLKSAFKMGILRFSDLEIKNNIISFFGNTFIK